MAFLTHFFVVTILALLGEASLGPGDTDSIRYNTFARMAKRATPDEDLLSAFLDIPQGTVVTSKAPDLGDPSGTVVLNIGNDTVDPDVAVQNTKLRFKGCDEGVTAVPAVRGVAVRTWVWGGQRRYGALCWDASSRLIFPEGTAVIDSGYVDTATDYLAYFTITDNPQTGAAKSTVDSRTPNISMAQSFALGPLNGSPKLNPPTAEDMIFMLDFASTPDGQKKVTPWFADRAHGGGDNYGLVVTSLKVQGNDLVDRQPPVRFCGPFGGCSQPFFPNKAKGPTFAPDLFPRDTFKYAAGTCKALMAQVSSVDPQISKVYYVITDENGFVISDFQRAEVPDSEVLFDKTHPVKPDLVPLPSIPFIYAGNVVTTDNPTVRYQLNNNMMTCKPVVSDVIRTCEGSFKCPARLPDDPNGFGHGTCALTMTQVNQTATQNTQTEKVPPVSADNLYKVTVDVRDVHGKSFAHAANVIAGDKNPLVLSGLPHDLKITPEIVGDTVFFNYDTQAWTSKDLGSPGCTVGPYQPQPQFPGFPARIIQCLFEC